MAEVAHWNNFESRRIKYNLSNFRQIVLHIISEVLRLSLDCIHTHPFQLCNKFFGYFSA